MSKYEIFLIWICGFFIGLGIRGILNDLNKLMRKLKY